MFLLTLSTILYRNKRSHLHTVMGMGMGMGMRTRTGTVSVLYARGLYLQEITSAVSESWRSYHLSHLTRWWDSHSPVAPGGFGGSGWQRELSAASVRFIRDRLRPLTRERGWTPHNANLPYWSTESTSPSGTEISFFIIGNGSDVIYISALFILNLIRMCMHWLAVCTHKAPTKLLHTNKTTIEWILLVCIMCYAYLRLFLLAQYWCCSKPHRR